MIVNANTIVYPFISMEEERARGEREAGWVATVTGRDIVRRGRFWGT